MFYGEVVRKFDLRHLPHAERQRWRNGGEWDERATKVAVGELGGGWWYARIYGPYDWVYEQIGRAWPSERLARRAAAGWMRIEGGTWLDAADGQPVEPDRRPRAPIGTWS